MKKSLNYKKINELCKKQRIFVYELLLNALKRGSYSTNTMSHSTVTKSTMLNPGNNLPLQNDEYPICPNCDRSLPNTSYLFRKGCIWCVQP